MREPLGRVTLRSGLPYGWWKHRDFYRGVLAIVSFLAMIALGALVLGMYFDGWEGPKL